MPSQVFLAPVTDAASLISSENTPAHTAPGWIGSLRLPSRQTGAKKRRLRKTLPGVPTPSGMQRVPPRHMEQHAGSGANPITNYHFGPLPAFD